MMTKRMRSATLAVAAVTLGLPAATRAGIIDPAACGIRSERVAAARDFCMDRCIASGKSAMDREVDPDLSAIARVFAQIGLCHELCGARYAAQMTQLQALSACSTAASSDRCGRALMRAEANRMRCRYKCAKREFRDPAFDQVACVETCDDSHEERITALLALSSCGDAS
jgi:hypothetical protein